MTDERRRSNAPSPPSELEPYLNALGELRPSDAGAESGAIDDPGEVPGGLAIDEPDPGRGADGGPEQPGETVTGGDR